MALSHINGSALADLTAVLGQPSISAINGFSATITDVTAPTLVSATVESDGDTWTLVFSEAVDFGAGGNGGFAPTMSGGAVALTYDSGSGTDTLVYTGDRTIGAGETGTLDYTQPTDGVEDLAGNDLATFTGEAVTNDVGGGSPAWVDTVASGSLTGGYASGGTETFGSKGLVATMSGDVTKLRAYNYTGSSSLIKINLYDSSWNLLASATESGPNGVGWVEIAITPTAVTSGNTYHVVAIAGAADFAFGYQAGQPGGSVYYDFGTYLYSTWGPPNPISFPSPAANNDLYAFGMYIEP